LKKQFSRKAAIELVMKNLKTDHRIRRNYYKGITGDAINIMLSSAGYNFKRMMRKWSASFWFLFNRHFISPTCLSIGQVISFFNQVIFYQKRNMGL